MIRAIAILSLLWAGSAVAQSSETSTMRVTQSGSAVLRGLDKVAGDIQDIEINVGQTKRLGRLLVTLGDCRYPSDNPAGDAFAYVVVREQDAELPEFAGWMIASSPALNALENPRYDLWAMRCKT